jgi:hypothetical protein
MLTIGWALVYWPWMPGGFLHTAELDAPGCWPPLSMQMTAPFRMPMSGT